MLDKEKVRRVYKIRYASHLQIGLLSDTHGFLDSAIFDYFAHCDEIWHAGDFGPVQLLDDLRNFKPVRAVWGNIDGAEIHASVPQDLHWECAGMKIYMTHITGYPGAWNKRVKTILTATHPDLVIGGHSHIARIVRDPALSLLHFNPGAAGHHGWHKQRTILRFRVDEAKVHDLQAIELGPRGRAQRDDPKSNLS